VKKKRMDWGSVKKRRKTAENKTKELRENGFKMEGGYKTKKKKDKSPRKGEKMSRKKRSENTKMGG